MIMRTLFPTCWRRMARFRCGLFGTARARLLLLLGLGSLVFPGGVRAAEQSKAVRTLEILAARKMEQEKAAAGLQAFHDFQFSNRREESQVRFRHHIVEDAGKHWKPAHYDHGNGVAVADVDGDGRPDIYFVTQLGSNELWRNLGGGKFEDITARSGLGLSNQICVAASFADIDNDGDPDLFVTTVRHGNHLFENIGEGRFRDITKEAGLEYVGHSSGAVFFDYDNDGRLDLFLCNVGVYTSETKGPGGYYLAYGDAFQGHLHPERTEYSILYRNLGKRKFKDVSAEVGLRDGSWSGDATFCDLNGDGYPDLYVLNMQGDNHYYVNEQGRRFVEKTPDYFPKTPWGAMGVKFFDYNNDGRMDLFVTDMHSDMTDPQRQLAGRLQLAVEKSKSEAWCAVQYTDAFLQGASNNIFGNAFYENKGGGKFVERSTELGLETYWPWGISAADLNADGFQDLFVSAGMGMPFRYAINSVLLNDAGRKFFDSEFLLGVEPRAGGRIERDDYFTLDCSGLDQANPLCAGKTGPVPFPGPISTRSSVIFDFDEDGDLDIITNEFNSDPQILVSNLSEKRRLSFLKIKLVGRKSNRDGLGATVRTVAGGHNYTQYHDGKSGYLSQSSLPLYFGLGEAREVTRVEVDWPSGKKQVLTEALPINALLTIRE